MKPFWTILLAVSVLSAAPAYERTRSYTQPDGTSFKGTPKGDEYLNWIETENGDIVLYNKETKRYEQATVGEEALQTSGRSYRPDKQAARRAPSRKQMESLHALWLKKRQERMRMRQGIKN